MIPEILRVEEIHTVVDQGVTEPIKCRLEGNIEAYVKYPNNRCGNLIIINELIGSSIAEKSGTSTWEYGLCELSQRTLELFSNGEYLLDESNSGLCFFSVAIPKLVPRVLWKYIGAEDCAKIILLDHILINTDRHSGNSYFDMNNCKLVAIDFSHILGDRNGLYPDYSSPLTMAGMDINKYLFNDILVANAEVYDEMFTFGRCTESALKKAASSMKQSLNDDFIINMMNSIPNEWKLFVENDTIKKLTELLLFRVNHLEQITDMIINERSNK